MSSNSRVSAGNRLIDSLPSGDRRRVMRACERTSLAVPAVLCGLHERIRHVYFPVSGLISLIMTIHGPASLEVGLIGNEGMFGMPLALGIEVSGARAVVQGAGTALRMEAALFGRVLSLSPALQREMHRYVFVAMSQLAQTVACTRFHVVEARLARWLLMTHDRAGGDHFHITQAWLAYMLGVRRVGVTTAASALQARGLIQYRRGDIEVLDRRGLMSAACRCYQADRDTYERTMGYAQGE
jgi:CRP-like cAMP-binding protein